MIQWNKFISTVALTVGSVAIISCSSSVEMGDIPSTANPQTEISKLEQMLNDAVTTNVDVLAPKEFKNSHEMLKEAKSDLADGEKQEEVLNDVRRGRTQLRKAYEVSEPRQGQAPGVFESRQYAIQAGAMDKSELKSDLKEIDSDLSNKADSLTKMSAYELSQFQKQYVDIEKRAVTITELGSSQAMLNGADKDDAESKAPNVFKKTEMALKNAESMISTNVRNPTGYQKSVDQANKQAIQLNQVMLMIKQNKNLSEKAALRMVSQNTQISNLKTELTDSEQSNDQLSTDLKKSNVNLDSAQASNEIQKALEAARAQFSSDEAEAYQQGGNLLIRMKKMNFTSGQSGLPASSLASLAKVSEVAKTLNAQSITVEGHTDSTGSEATNMTISEARAEAVATYLKSNGFDDIEVQSTGFGFQKPIATNKSKEGRTLNRRVDIVITPKNSTTVQ